MNLVLLLALALLAPQTTPESFLAAYASEHNFNGSILIQEDGQVTFAKSFGLADTYFFRPDLKAMVHDLPMYPENWSTATACGHTRPRSTARSIGS